MTNSTPTYTPTVGDICYMVKGDSDNRTFGAMVRITKIRSWKYVSKVWIQNVEGFHRSADCLTFYDWRDAKASLGADMAEELLEVNHATILDKENFAAARFNRAKREAEEVQKRRDAEAHEKEFIKQNSDKVNAPLQFSDVAVVVAKDASRINFRKVAMFHKFSGRGFEIFTEIDSLVVSVQIERKTEWDYNTCSPKNAGKFVLNFHSNQDCTIEEARAFAEVLDMAIKSMDSLNAMLEDGVELTQGNINSLFAHAMA